MSEDGSLKEAKGVNELAFYICFQDVLRCSFRNNTERKRNTYKSMSHCIGISKLHNVVCSRPYE